MNLYEYMQYIWKKTGRDDTKLRRGEDGNVYVSSLEGCYEGLGVDDKTEWPPVICINKDVVERYRVEISADLRENFFESVARRPHYRMRGKPVTEEQAFEIIWKTDNAFWRRFGKTWRKLWSDPYLGSINFDNNLFAAMGSWHGGWIHPDGTVGTNNITQKFPNLDEYVTEWLRNLIAFPYLDLVIAVTWWDEIPPDAWEDSWEQCRDFEDAKYDDEFFEAIEMGIYVHDNTVEILDPKKTIEKYKEYQEKYGKEHPEKYRRDYYDENKIAPTDDAYLRRCIACYGMSEEENERIFREIRRLR